MHNFKVSHNLTTHIEMEDFEFRVVWKLLDNNHLKIPLYTSVAIF